MRRQRPRRRSSLSATNVDVATST